MIGIKCDLPERWHQQDNRIRSPDIVSLQRHWFINGPKSLYKNPRNQLRSHCIPGKHKAKNNLIETDKTKPLHFTLHRFSLAQLSVIREKNTQLAASPLGRKEKNKMYVQHSGFSGGCLTLRAWFRALVGDWPNWDVWGPLRTIERLGACCCTKEPTVYRDSRQRKW